jgi:hypothetical protein
MGTMPSNYAADKEENETVTFFMPVYKMDDPLWYRELLDATSMTIIGFTRTAIAVMPLVLYSPVFSVMMLFGLTHGLAYWLAWKLPHDNKVHWFSNPEGSVHNAEYGELIWGFFLGLGFLLIGLNHG